VDWIPPFVGVLVIVAGERFCFDWVSSLFVGRMEGANEGAKRLIQNYHVTELPLFGFPLFTDYCCRIIVFIGRDDRQYRRAL